MFQNAGTIIAEKGMSTNLNIDTSIYNMTKENNSTFIDIGSGFGKPVFHSAMQTGC